MQIESKMTDPRKWLAPAGIGHFKLDWMDCGPHPERSGPSGFFLAEQTGHGYIAA